MASRLDAASITSVEGAVRGAPIDGSKQEPATPTKAWPLPRRLTRSNAIPLANIHHSPSPGNNEVDFSRIRSARGGSFDIAPLSPPKPRIEASKPLRFANSDLSASPNLPLHPKPLFSGQQRSISHGMLSELTVKTRQGSGTRDRDVFPLPQQSIERRSLPRSSSLWSQDPGIVPDRPVPLLPIEGTLQRLARVKSLREPTSRRGSDGFSDNTSVLDGSRAFSQADTDLTSAAIASPLVPESLIELHGHHGSPVLSINTAYDRGKNDTIEMAKPLPVRSYLDSHKSKHASIQDSLPRSDSSGISKYIGYNWSRNTSDLSLNRDTSDSRPKSRLAVPGSVEKVKSRQAVSPSPLSNDTTIETDSKRQSKRASTSVLQSISGNEGSLRANPWDNRPSSFTTSEPFEWDPVFFLQPGKRATLDLDKGHKRQNCMRTSSISIGGPKSSPIPETIQEREELHQDLEKALGSLRQSRNTPTSFRPPSALIFDPQLKALTPPAPYGTLRTNKSGANPYSPTLSMCNLYGENESPNPSPISTPSHKPRHPNRVNAIFDTADKDQWPLPSVPKDLFQLDGPSSTFNIFRFDAEQNINPAASPRDSTSPSKFPLPPRHPARTIRASLKSAPQIRGPRAPPSGFSPSRQRSPTKGILKNSSSSPKRGSKNLSTSIMALRRMNSEANDGVAAGRLSREHKRYLSLNDNDALALEDGEDNAESGKENRSCEVVEVGSSPGNEASLRTPQSERRWWRNSGLGSFDGRWQDVSRQRTVKGPREMSFFDAGTMCTPTKENGRVSVEEDTPGSKYDDSGFLKE
ncbi:MAG: hypothetical protein Q9164_002123 [Protoblastenia rupestris]